MVCEWLGSHSEVSHESNAELKLKDSAGLLLR